MHQPALFLQLTRQHFQEALRPRSQLVLVEGHMPVDHSFAVLGIELVFDTLSSIAEIEHELRGP